MPVAADAAFDAHQSRPYPFRIMNIISTPVYRQFLQQIKTHFVTQFRQCWRRQKMSAYGIDIRLLHQIQAFPQPVFRCIHAVFRMKRQVIDSAELDKTAIQFRPFWRQIKPAETGAVAVKLRLLPGGGKYNFHFV